MNDKQLRGHCQLCGCEQAVLRGTMAHHGYTVEHGYFNGACGGHDHRPIELERKYADLLCESVLVACRNDDHLARRVKEGKVTPTTVVIGRKRDIHSGKWIDEEVPYAEAPEIKQREAAALMAVRLERRADNGRQFVKELRAIIDERHGKPLREVEREAKPEEIIHGDRRVRGGHVLVACRVEGARVYWRTEQGRKGWTGKQAWRKMERPA